MAGQSVGAVYVDAILNNKKFNNQISNTVKGAEKSFTSSFSKIGAAITAALSVTAVTAFASSCVDAAMKAESAFMGLNSQLTAQGRSFADAKSWLEEYVADGLVPMTNAASAYKQLASAGFDDAQIRDMMEATKDMATYNRQAHYSMGEAVEVFAQGVKNEESTLTDAAGMTKNLSVMYEEYAATIGKTAASLTQAEKTQAIYTATMNEWQYSMGNAATMTNTFAGRLTRLKATFTSIKTEIGNVIIPIVDLFMPAIQAAANAVLNFIVRIKQMLAIFGLEMQEIGGGSGAADSVTSGFDAAADSAGAAADAIGSTGTAATAAAKAVKRALAPYDELNKLTFADNSSSGGGSGGSGGSTDSALEDALNSSTEIVSGTDDAFSQMAATAQRLFEKLKTGFENAFGETNLDGIKAHFTGITESLSEIFNDEAREAAQGFLDSFAGFIGSAAGSAARLSVNLAEWLTGSVDYSLETTKEDLQKRFTRIFDGLSLQLDLGGSILESLGEISDVFQSDEAKRLGGELLSCITIPATTLWQVGVDTANTVLQSIDQTLEDNKEGIETAMTNMFEFGGDIVQPVREALQGIADAYDDTYEEHIKPASDKFAQGWSDFTGGFLDVWNEKGKPILDKIGELWDEFVKGDLGEAIEKVVEAGGKVIGFFGELWETIGGNAGEQAGEKAVGVLTVIEGIVDAVLKLLGFFVDLGGLAFEQIGNIFEILTGFFEGFKTGDWSKVKEGMVGAYEVAGDLVSTILELVGIDFDFTEWVKGAIEGGGEFIQGLKDGITEALDNIGQWIQENIFDPITDWFKKLFGIHSPSTVFAEYGGYIIDGLKQGLLDAKGKIDEAWEKVKGWFSDIVATAKVKISQKWSDIKTSWENLTTNIKDKTANMKAKVATTWASIKNAWNSTTENIKDKTANMKAKIATTWASIKSAWTSTTQNIKDKTANMKAKVGTTWSDLKTKWNNLVNNFKDKTVTVTMKVKSVISDMKSWVNTNVIKKINKYVPFVSIPYLAQGGWLPANAPQLAVVGDNRREGEIIAPESKIREQVKQALSEVGGGMMGTIRLEIALPDGRTIIKEINRAQMAAGKVLLNV